MRSGGRRGKAERSQHRQAAGAAAQVRDHSAQARTIRCDAAICPESEAKRNAGNIAKLPALLKGDG